MRGTILIALVAAALCRAFGAPEDTGKQPLRDDVVAAVLTSRSAGSGTIHLSYPHEVSLDEIAADLTAMSGVTQWRFGPPSASVKGDATEATAEMMPAAPAGTAVHPVWPVVWALKRFNRVTVAFMAPALDKTPPPVSTEFVQVTWSGGSGLWCCDAVIHDRGFKSLEDLQKPTGPAGEKESVAGAGNNPMRRTAPWVILSAAALGAGVLTFVLLTRNQRRRS